MENKVFNGFIFVDIETTGIVPREGHILEIGMAHFDRELNMLNMFQSLVHTPDSRKYLTAWKADDYVYKMHENSGLLADLHALGNPAHENSIQYVQETAIRWLEDCGVLLSKNTPWCGSSVHFDKEWITFHMPALSKMFGYRTIDPSGIREYVKIVAPDVFSKIEKKIVPRKEHRVMADILDSVELLNAFREFGALIK